MYDLAETLGDLYQQNFSSVADDYSNQLALLEHLTNTYSQGITDLETRGYFVSTDYYKALQQVESQNISIMESELVDLTNALNQAVNSGAIEEYSSAWYDMQTAINDVAESIQQATTNLAEYEKAMRELEWSYFDYVEDLIDNINSEADFLIDLMSNSNLFEEGGKLTDTGITTMGLHAQNYDVYMRQADDYAAEIQALNKEIANDPYNQDLIERRTQLITLQQEAILAAEDEKEAIVDLVEQGIELELEALSDLISSYEDALDSAKDLYDYQRKIQDQTSTIATLQKQLSSLQNDTSEENKATVQKIQVSLAEAMQDLADTQFDNYISEQKKLLDDLYDEYELVLNMRLDDIDALLADMINMVNINADTIYQTLIEQSDKVGYTMTDEMDSIWSQAAAEIRTWKEQLGYSIDDLGTKITTAVTTYGTNFSDKQTTTNTTLDTIKAYVGSMVNASNKTASTTVSTTKSTASSSVSGSSSKSSSSSSSSSSSGTLAVGKKVKYVSGNYYYSSYGDTPLGAYHQGEYVYVTKIVSGRAYPVHISTGYPLGNGDLGWVKTSQISGYKQGGLIDYTGIAEVHGSQKNPEMVLNAKDTENFIALKDVLSEAMSGNSPLADKLNGNVHSNVLQNLAEKSGLGDICAGSDIGTVNNNIDIDIDHVEDYDDFVNQLVKDDQFEKFIQAMTVDRMVGGSRLTKNKYKW